MKTLLKGREEGRKEGREGKKKVEKREKTVLFLAKDLHIRLWKFYSKGILMTLAGDY